jgi:hypothetical protein
MLILGWYLLFETVAFYFFSLSPPALTHTIKVGSFRAFVLASPASVRRQSCDLTQFTQKL